MNTIGITGGTGFVGQHLTALLLQKGYKVIIFTTRRARTPAKGNVSYAHWHPNKEKCDINALKEVNAMVHLAGAGIADKRWTAARKKEITDSRIKGTGFLVTQLKTHAINCKTFIAASAIGFYGPDYGKGPFTENDAPYNDFLGNTCRQWEESSQQASSFLRTAILRFGIVLGEESGAFPQFLKPMSLGVMPILGSGGQMMSWIAVTDLARLIVFALGNEQFSGIYNAVAPHPVSHWQLMKTIAAKKGGFKIHIHVPSFALKILLGEMSGEILKSCTVSAQKTLDAGFIYSYPDLDKAVDSILNKTITKP